MEGNLALELKTGIFLDPAAITPRNHPPEISMQIKSAFKIDECTFFNMPKPWKQPKRSSRKKKKDTRTNGEKIKMNIKLWYNHFKNNVIKNKEKTI